MVQTGRSPFRIPDEVDFFNLSNSYWSDKGRAGPKAKSLEASDPYGPPRPLTGTVIPL
jgi:hypothetical protein